MNKKAILLIAALLISVAAFGFVYSRRKKDDGTDDNILNLPTGPQNTGVVPPNTQQQISNAIKTVAVAAPAIKAIGNVVKNLLQDHVGTVVSDQMKNLAENVATDVIKNGGTIAEGAEAAMTKTSEALAEKVAQIGAGTATAGTTGGTSAAGAASGISVLSIALPLVILGGIITWAVSMGVFDMTDWTPPYGQVPLKLNAYGASVAGLHEGDTVLVTPDVMAKIIADPSNTYLYSYLEANRHAVEAKQAAIDQNQRQIDAQQATAEAATQAAEAARQAQIVADNAATEQARIAAQNIADQLAQQQQAAELAAVKATAAASETVRQGIALRGTGNVGTQYNYELSEFEEL